MIENSVFMGNTTVTSGYGNVLNVNIGGGVNHENQGYLNFRNVLFYNNFSHGYGGAIAGRVPTEMYNCTIVGNRARNSDARGSGIMAEYKLVVYNTIIYSNEYPTWEVYVRTHTPTNAFFTNCCMTKTNLVYLTTTNDVPGTGNFAANPMVQNWAGQNYRLQVNSPCVNRGFNMPWMTNAVDLDGRKRIRYGTVDIGAYELIYDGTIYKYH